MPLFDFPGSNSKRARAWGVEREGDSREGVSGVVIVDDVERVLGREGRFEAMMSRYSRLRSAMFLLLGVM